MLIPCPFPINKTLNHACPPRDLKESRSWTVACLDSSSLQHSLLFRVLSLKDPTFSRLESSRLSLRRLIPLSCPPGVSAASGSGCPTDSPPRLALQHTDLHCSLACTSVLLGRLSPWPRWPPAAHAPCMPCTLSSHPIHQSRLGSFSSVTRCAGHTEHIHEKKIPLLWPNKRSQSVQADMTTALHIIERNFPRSHGYVLSSVDWKLGRSWRERSKRFDPGIWIKNLLRFSLQLPVLENGNSWHETLCKLMSAESPAAGAKRSGLMSFLSPRSDYGRNFWLPIQCPFSTSSFLKGPLSWWRGQGDNVCASKSLLLSAPTAKKTWPVKCRQRPWRGLLAQVFKVAYSARRCLFTPLLPPSCREPRHHDQSCSSHPAAQEELEVESQWQQWVEHKEDIVELRAWTGCL